MAISRNDLFDNELKGLYDNSADKVSKQDTGVSFNRTNARPIDWTTIFPSFTAASAWAATGTNAYPGHILQVVDAEEGVKVYKVQLDGTLSQIDATIQPGDLPISAGAGINFTTEGGKTVVNAKLKSGNGLTADNEGYLSVQQLDLDGVVDSTKAQSSAVPYTSAVWAAISADTTSAQVSSIAQTIFGNSVDGKITGGGTSKTLTAIGYNTSTSSLCGSYADIAITSAQVTNFKQNVDTAIGLSVATLSVDAITANGAEGSAITSISQSNGKITASAGKITVAADDVTGLTNYVSSVSASTLNAANAHSDSISGALSGYLSSKWSYELSDNNTNPVVLSSDISNIVAKGVTFGGVYGTSAELTGLTSAIAGQVFVLTGAGYNGKEYICKADNTTPAVSNFVEVGDEGTIGSIAQKLDTVSTDLGTVSGKVDNKIVLSAYGNPGTSSTIETLQINRMTAAEYKGLTSYADDQLYVLTDAQPNMFGERILSVGTPTLSGDAANKAYVDAVSGALNTSITNITDSFNGKVALSTATEVRNAISGDISSALNLGALAHKDTVGTTDIDNAAVTSAKIAPNSITRDHLSGWFVLSCGSATQDGNISPSDL